VNSVESHFSSKKNLEIDFSLNSFTSKMNFPYYENYVSDDFIKFVFNELKNYRPTVYRIDDVEEKNLFFIKINFETEKKFLFLSDYFTQEARMKARFLDNISPLEWWEQRGRKEIPTYLPYDEIYEKIWKRTKMCSSFPIVVVKAIIDHYKPSSIFDPSAGWGDRILASIASEIPYDGVDPNRDLMKGYMRIIDFFDLEPSSYNFFSIPFEEYSNIENKKYDLILTSPPFYNMETYSEDKYQSTRRYPTYELWRDLFLFCLLSRCTKMLNSGGRMIIYVNNIKGYRILDDVKERMKKEESVYYEGWIGWENTKYTKKLLVYLKK
jgi:hypothetical protein